MNALLSFVVAVVSVLIVVGLGVWGVNALAGRFAILGWIVVGWFALLGILKAVRS